MARNRIIYQSEALYAGPAPATGFHFTYSTGQATTETLPAGFSDGAGLPTSNYNVLTGLAGFTGWADVPVATFNSGVVNSIDQLQRVQTANYSFTVNRTDVNQFGQLAAIDRVILTNPTVALDFSYLVANLANEKNLGFTVNQSGDTQEVSAISGFLNGTQDERNYFIRTVPEGNDAVGFNSQTSGNNGVIGVGNGFISSFSTEGSVGNFPTTTINVEGLNMNFQKGLTGNYIPAVNPVDGSEIENYYTLPLTVENTATGVASGISALRPGDITLTIPQTSGGGVTASTMNIQSYTLSFDLTRTPIERLGSKFAFSRPIDFPLTVTLSIDAQVTEMTAGSISDLVCDDSATYDPVVSIKNPACGNNDVVAQYKLKGAKLDSQEFSSDIGTNKTVTLTFSAQVGGPQDLTRGLFISGQA